MRWRFLAAAMLGLLASACAKENVGDSLHTGASAYEVMPAPTGQPSAANYKIGALDTVEISVFQESDISQKGVLVDAAGNISMPLIGRIQAAGLTTTQLADVVAKKLGERFYVDPQVTVAVTSSVAQRVTVEGEVTEPGIYPIQGTTTLLDTIALAKGETENAALRQAIIVRYVDGKRTGAVFDLKRIRRGDDPDPTIEARDVVIVGHSGSKKALHDLLRAAPLLNVFAQF